MAFQSHAKRYDILQDAKCRVTLYTQVCEALKVKRSLNWLKYIKKY